MKYQARLFSSRVCSQTLRLSVLALLCVLMSPMMVSEVSAQSLVTKPIRLMVGQPAGGGTDAIARILAQAMTE